METLKVPKKIHYCWFGSRSLPYLHERCVATWSRKASDFEIVHWGEHNTDIDTPFLKWAVKRGHWAFVSDYIRMRAIHTHGGVYLDADMELVRDPTPLLFDACFLGMEAAGRPTTGIFGAESGHAFPQTCMDMIDARFASGKPYLIAPEVAIACLAKPGMESVRIYSQEYFYPYNPYDPDRPGQVLMYSDITDRTYAIHHWAKGWKHSPMTKIMRKLFR